VTALPTPEDLTRIWRELSGEQHNGQAGRFNRRVLVGNGFDCFLVVEFPQRRRALSVVAHAGAGTPLSPRSVLSSGVEVRVVADPTTGRPGVDLVLTDPSHQDIFTALAADLINVLDGTDSNPDGGLGVVTSRIRRWQRLLAGVRPEGLLPQLQRGLFGELTLLEEILSRLGASAVTAWTGPDPACQDFQFPQAAIEVKTTSAGHPNLVRVSGERQLHDTAGTPLHLVTYVLDARRGGNGTTLPELVERLGTSCAQLGVTEELADRLAAAGYLPTQAHLYAEPHYVVTRRFFHRITDGFPRLVPNLLPDGVSEVTYTLDLAAASAHATTFEEILHLLGGHP
jgi:hypothetical protein